MDETYISREPGTVMKKGGVQHKMKMLSFVDRATGPSRSMVMDTVTIASATLIVGENVAREARLMTDEAGMYRYMSIQFAFHGTTLHAFGEYGRGDIHTNIV